MSKNRDKELVRMATNLLAYAQGRRDAEGRSPEGRQLAVVCTDLEKVKAFICYNRL